MNRLTLMVLIFGVVMTMGELNWSMVIISVMCMVGFVIVNVYYNQEKLLYQPQIPGYPQFSTPRANPQSFRSPAEYNMPYDDVYLTTADKQTLHAWFIKQPETFGCPTLLYFQANAGNMGFRLPNLNVLYKDLKCNILIMSYRGYGESTGEPNEQGLELDAEAAWQWVAQNPHVDQKQLVVFGRSLGGAVALSLVCRHSEQVKALILENTFTCISDMVDQLMPMFTPIKPCLLRMNWPSIERVRDVTCPILFITGQQDEVVPTAQMEALYGAADSTPSRTIARFPDGMHNDTWSKVGYAEVLTKFWSTHVAEIPVRDSDFAYEPANMVAPVGSGSGSAAGSDASMPTNIQQPVSSLSAASL